MPQTSHDRSVALDAFRGAVMLLLIPDVRGGLSMYRLAENYPDSTVIAFLARQLTHAQWSGCTVWDLVMPGFLFAAGMSMAYSRAARIHDPASSRDALLHVGLRAAALLVLGMLVQLPVRSYFDLAWPLLIVGLGLSWRRRALGRRTDMLLWVGLLSAAALWIAANAARGYWSFHDILPQLGLAYVFAYLIAGLPPPWRMGTCGAILTGYWLLFALFPTPQPGFLLSTVGVAPGDEVLTGFFAHWNKGSNVAAAFDREFLNLLPRAEPFVFNSHGYQTLNFVPATVSIVLGAIAGDLLRSGKNPVETRNDLVRAGLAGVVVGWILGITVCPVVKSIWTPAWVVFSTGWVLLVFAAFYQLFEVGRRSRLAFPLVVVGINPLLVYVLALYYRPWILGPWQKALPLDALDAGWSPLVAPALVSLSLWLLAFAMYRLRIAVRL